MIEEETASNETEEELTQEQEERRAQRRAARRAERRASRTETTTTTTTTESSLVDTWIGYFEKVVGIFQKHPKASIAACVGIALVLGVGWAVGIDLPFV